jgi:hypothetical protein
MMRTEPTWEPKSIKDAEYLYDVAHTRTGDKRDISNVVVVAWNDEDYDELVDIVTEDRVKKHYDGLVKGEIERYCVPNLSTMNFVMQEALDGGVTRSRRVDTLGKALGRHMLMLPLRDKPKIE